jgi:predicted XRE-type DNA-binding protein
MSNSDKLADLRLQKPCCAVEDCENPIRSKGLCIAHYHRLRRYGSPTAGGTPHGAPMKWLRDQLDTNTDECAPYPFALTPGGYSVLSFNGTQTSAHRIVAILAYGEPDARLDAAHSCRLRSCCNPRHIRWATHDENMQDMVKDGTRPIGERNGQVKLTEAQAVEIRALLGTTKQCEIAAIFGVSRSTISDINTRRIWRHI